MDIGNFLVMVLALIAVAYSLISTFLIITGKKESPLEDPFDDEDDEAIFPAIKESTATPPPPITFKKTPKSTAFDAHKFDFETSYDHYESHSAIEDRALKSGLRKKGELVSDRFIFTETEGVVLEEKKKTPIRTLLKQMPSKGAMIISYEVFSKPVGFRQPPFPWNK